MSVIRLGWIEPKHRSDEAKAKHAEILARMPKFAMVPQATPPVGTKVLLTDAWKHPLVVGALGKAFTGFHQLTGSCVGAGGGNVLATTSFLQSIKLGTEVPTLPFWMLPYGRSRLDAGMRGQGEGSLGSTFAQACREDGVTDANAQGAPTYDTSDGFTYTESLESQWSDGAQAPANLLTQSRNHLIKTTSPLTTAAQVRDAILSGYAVARAFSGFTNPGQASVKGSSGQQVLIGNYNGSGGHQESWQGYWNHPDLGELILEPNQWGLQVYGTDPGGAPLGSVWQTFDNVNRMMQRGGDAEVYAFSSLEGFPVQSLDWMLVA